MRTTDKGTFEMLWDCPACGTTGLLGKSHRHCPSCGSPQDEKRRYFPKPGEETRVANHTFDGADKKCAACSTPMGARASNCANCGAPLDGSATVARLADQVVGRDFDAPPQAPPPRAGRSKGCLVAVALIVVVVAAVAVFALWKKDVEVAVTQHRWEKEIAIERFDAVHDSAWCDSLPGGAYNVSRSREVRDHKKIPDGEECRTKNVDNGDGTFKQVEECRPKYRDEPIYDDKCRFDVDRWHVGRSERSAGVGLQSTPAWPTVRLARTGTCRGCEREGARTERWLLDLASDKDTFACDVGEAKWRATADGARLPMQVRVLGGGADCSSLGR